MLLVIITGKADFNAVAKDPLLKFPKQRSWVFGATTRLTEISRKTCHRARTAPIFTQKQGCVDELP
jgi:hypothetical protein